MKKRTVFSRCLLLLLTVVLILGLVPAASAAKITKATKTHEIAVVFDNSGSMYANSNGSAWCQAKYAMEIFASMIDYENGDKMTIFPMWEVTTDGKIPKQTEADLAGETPSELANSKNAIKITSMEDVKKIHNMYTPVAGGTPIETVEDAYEYIKKSKADEKWLVILTDGKMQKKNPISKFWENMEESDVKSTLHGYASEKVKVQYIAFNKNPNNAYALSAAENFYCPNGVITSAKALEQEVVNACNRIFQRDVLTEGLSGSALNLKISMSKLIVFAQGDANVTLKKGGNVVDSDVDSGQRTYSEVASGSFWEQGEKKQPFEPQAPIADTSLAGRIITYSDLEKGDYTIECTGSMEIFYEPGVTLQVTLTDPNGKVVEFDPKEDEATVEPGNYTVQVKLIDKVTGEDVTNNPLMGNVKIGITATVNKEARTIENGGTLALEPETDVKVDITGTYLEKYTITNDEDSSIFPPKISVEKSKALTVKAEVPGDGWYSLMEKKNWKPIRLELQLEGEKLTEEQMKALTLNGTVKSGKEVALRYEPLNGESAVLVYVGQAEDGSFVKPAKGARDVTFEASVPSKFSKPYTASKTVAVNVKGLPKWVVIGMVSLAGLLLLLLALLILNIKVLPKKIFRDTAEFVSSTAGTLGQNFVDVRYSRKGRSLTIASTSVASDEKCTVTFKLKPSDPLRKKSRDRHYTIVGINSNCASVSINSVEYVKNANGTWVKETLADSPKPPPIAHDGYRIMVDLVRVSGGVITGTLNCKVKTK